MMFHPKTAEFTLFSSVHGTFSKIEPTLGHKTSLNTFKKIEIISCIFSDHKGMRIEITTRKNCKKHKHMEAKYATNYKWVTEEIKQEIKKYWETSEKLKHNPSSKIYGMQQ